MRHRKTACFGPLVLEPHFDQILGRPMFACLPFLAFLGPKTDPFLVIYIYIIIYIDCFAPIVIAPGLPRRVPRGVLFQISIASRPWRRVSRPALRLASSLRTFLFCCNFHSLKAVPLRQLRPKILARHQSAQLLQIEPCWDSNNNII